MQPEIIFCNNKKLVGKRITMSFAENKTGELWRAFMPVRKQIQNPVDSNLYSVQIYDTSFLDPINRNLSFEKWAAVEVTDLDHVPEGMESFTLSSGLYAVFNYKGPASDHSIFSYIFNTWLPPSGYDLDMRPHFEILGEKYKNDDPLSEEEIWIPVKQME